MKPLEALERIRKKHYFVDFELDTTVGKDCKEELDIIESTLKALEIIMKYPFVVNLDYRLDYNEQIDLVKEYLTQEEYDLLKEVLL